MFTSRPKAGRTVRLLDSGVDADGPGGGWWMTGFVEWCSANLIKTKVLLDRSRTAAWNSDGRS